MAGRTPDYRVVAIRRQVDDVEGERKEDIGAAWLNDSGTISITLNTFVVLDCSQHIKIYLYPVKERPK